MQYIDKLNGILKEFTKIRIDKIDKESIELSNGRKLIGEADRRKLNRRITNRSTQYLKYFDNIYSIDLILSLEYERKAKSETSAIGGKACQRKHGEKIKQNLMKVGDIPWNKGMAGSYPHQSWAKGRTKFDTASLQKLSEDRTGSGNPLYGKVMTKEEKDHKSNVMKEMIMSGKFTPQSNNRNTHWDSMFDNKKFRSSWEALYQALNEEAVYETLRLPYIVDGIESIYIVDFIDYKDKIVIEVKPKEHQIGKKYEAKMATLVKWARAHKFEVKIFDQDTLCDYDVSQIDYTKFCNNTRRKVESFIKKYYEVN